MTQLRSNRTKKLGLAPGSMVYTGASSGEVTYSLMHYTPESVSLRTPATSTDAIKQLEASGVTWLNINGVHDVSAIETIGTYFKLHPLTLEDIVSVGQRPKLEVFDTYVFIVARMLQLNDAGDGVVDEQVSFVVGEQLVLTFQEREQDVFDAVRERIKQDKGRIRKLGADYLTYTLLDVMIDHYFLILEYYGEALETLEDALIEHPSPHVLHTLSRYKRELIFVRKSVWPLREVLGACLREEDGVFSAPVRTYLRDAYDHTIQVIETLETQRDLLASLVDLYLSSMSNKTNEVMKVLTIIATLFIPLTFIVGVYGMNFEFMPELHWRYGYAGVWGIMILISGGLVIYFKKKKWL